MLAWVEIFAVNQAGIDTGEKNVGNGAVNYLLSQPFNYITAIFDELQCKTIIGDTVQLWQIPCDNPHWVASIDRLHMFFSRLWKQM